MTAIRKRIAEEAKSEKYELVFLVDNMESLVNACDESARTKPKERKPTPDLRDRILGRAAWEGSPLPRLVILSACPSFNRRKMTSTITILSSTGWWTGLPPHCRPERSLSKPIAMVRWPWA